MRFLKEIERLAKAHHCENHRASHEALRRSLEWWWCQKFNRPIKDPLLQTYTDEELLYEFLRHQFMSEDPREAEIAQKRLAEDTEWATEMAKKISKTTQKVGEVARAIETPEEAPKPTEPEMELPPIKFDFTEPK